MRYDLILKGGTVIDPSQGLNGLLDVGVSDGKIAAIQRDIPAEKGGEVIDVRGRYVTPGLVDLHTHVYWGVTTWGVKADPSCLAYGVTTTVDAGSPGWANFPGFREFIVRPAKTRILTFVHISGIGLTYGPVGEMTDLSYAAPEQTAEAILKHPDLTVGVKVRQGGAQVGDNHVEPLRLAVKAAEMAKTRVMVHIGGGVSLQDVLAELRPGDIVTHCFRGGTTCILDPEGRIIPEAAEGRRRGVIFDIGHGGGSFHFDVGAMAIEQGFLPDVISSDLHSHSIRGPVFDMPTTLTKFLNLGMSLEEVIERSTLAPARVIGREGEIGGLQVGRSADVAVLAIREEECELFDAHRNRLVGRRRLVAELTVREGKVYRPGDFAGVEPV